MEKDPRRASLEDGSEDGICGDAERERERGWGKDKDDGNTKMYLFTLASIGARRWTCTGRSHRPKQRKRTTTLHLIRYS
jgi:hypothetical protein